MSVKENPGGIRTDATDDPDEEILGGPTSQEEEE